MVVAQAGLRVVASCEPYLARWAAKARCWFFETDDGRTLAGAAASFLDFVVVIAFF